MASSSKTGLLLGEEVASVNQILTILDADIDVTVKTELELKSGNGR